MDLSSWESTIGAGGASFLSKVQQMTDSLTGKSGGSEDSKSKPITQIPFTNPDTSQNNEEVWFLGRKYKTECSSIENSTKLLLATTDAVPFRVRTLEKN